MHIMADTFSSLRPWMFYLRLTLNRTCFVKIVYLGHCSSYDQHVCVLLYYNPQSSSLKNIIKIIFPIIPTHAFSFSRSPPPSFLSHSQSTNPVLYVTIDLFETSETLSWPWKFLLKLGNRWKERGKWGKEWERARESQIGLKASKCL